MRQALFLLLLSLPVPALAEDKKPAPKDAPALELPEPQKVEPASGYIKIQAKASGPVSYFLSAVWDNGEQTVQNDILGGVLVIGIPNHEGLITIVASVNGGPGQPPIQKSTSIAVERKVGAKKEGGAAAPVTHHATVIGAVDRTKLEGPLAAAGVKLWHYAPGDPKLAARTDLTETQTKLGGGACLILSDGTGKVVDAVALPATGGEAAVLSAIHKALGGK